MKKSILSLALIAAVATSWAQSSVEGVVRDENGAPLAGVVVQHYDGAGVVLTDVNGEFVITANKGDKLTFNYADALIRNVVVGKGDLNIKLTDKDLSLSNRGALSTSRTMSQAVATVSGDELRSKSSLDVADA